MRAPATPQEGPLPGYTLPKTGTPATMMGFCRDYATNSSDAIAPEIMQCYSATDLAVINGLARGFAVCDEYFCSVPTHTYPNRGFAGTGSSIGPYKSGKTIAFADNHHKGVTATFNGRSLWKVLFKAGKTSPSDWTVYYSTPDFKGKEYCFTRQLMLDLETHTFDPFFQPDSSFFTACSNGSLPAFSYFEPAWDQADYHPPYNTLGGEDLLWTIYQALTKSPAWDSTLLIINFDEHGGTYDHYPPPWGGTGCQDIVPWGNKADGLTSPDEQQHSFGYDRYGARVPLILVSPCVPESTVFRADGPLPYDHTSVIATLLDWFGVPRTTWQMGTRVANAPSFAEVVSLNTPRTDIPKIPEPPKPSFDTEDVEPTDLLREVLEGAIRCAARDHGAEVEQSDRELLASATTNGKLKAAYREIMGRLSG